MHAQVVAAVEGERGAVAAVQLDEAAAAGHVAGVVGHGDHEVEDDVFGEQVEEVIAVHVFAQAFLDDAEERIQGPEVLDVVYHWTHSLRFDGRAGALGRLVTTAPASVGQSVGRNRRSWSAARP